MRVRTPAIIVAASLWATSALAHHSFAMFDHEKEVTVVGTVKDFEWTNPHSFIYLTVKDPNGGGDQDWAIEGSSPNTLKRRGWTRKSLEAGQRVTLTLNPLRSGGRGGALVKVQVEGRAGKPLY